MAPVAQNEDEDIDAAYGAAAFASVGAAPPPANFQLPPRSPGAAAAPASLPPFLVREQARDGNCLFRSFSDQLYGTPEHHASVRERCSQYIASERNYFEQFVAEPFDAFLARIQRDGEWGDDVEIEALSEIYDCHVEIYASYSHSLMRTFHEACDATWPHPVRLQYEGAAHYNSLAPRDAFVPVAQSMPGNPLAPGELEDAAISRSRRRQDAGNRRAGIGEADLEQTEREFLDESIRRSRSEFEHQSAAEMDRALEDSRAEWERTERKRMDEEVVETIIQQSVLEEEQKQISMAMQESKEMIMQNRPEYAFIYGQDRAAASSSAGNEADNGSDTRDCQYPESVYAVMSMGFPLEACIQAYHFVGDNPEGILAYCCQNLGR